MECVFMKSKIGKQFIYFKIRTESNWKEKKSSKRQSWGDL